MYIEIFLQNRSSNIFMITFVHIANSKTTFAAEIAGCRQKFPILWEAKLKNKYSSLNRLVEVSLYGHQTRL